MSFFDLFRWCGFAPNPKPDAPPAASAPSIYLNADGSPRCDYLIGDDEPEPPYLEFDPDRAEDYDTDWNDK